MSIDDILQLGRVHIVAGGDDHPLDPLAEVHKAVLVHAAQIAGVEPNPALRMAAKGLGSLLRVIHIAQHHRRPGDADLPVGVGW